MGTKKKGQTHKVRLYNPYDYPDVVHISNVLSWALPKPTYFSYLDIRKVCKRTSRLDAPSRPAGCARSLNVENSPSAQTVRRFSSLTFAQAGSRLGA